MHRTARPFLTLALFLALPLAAYAQHGEHHPDQDSKIENALSAAPAGLAEHAAVMDWDQSVLKEGTNGYTCLPTPPDLPGNAPMCLDAQWMKWAEAWMNRTEPEFTAVGIAYMLRGDAGASNTDPYATDRAGVADWIESGPHLMVVVPDPAMLDNLPTDYESGTPWVMWQGTPYVHIMIPLGHGQTRER